MLLKSVSEFFKKGIGSEPYVRESNLPHICRVRETHQDTVSAV